MSHTRPGTFGPSHVQVSGDCACLSLRVWSLRGRESTRPPRQPRSGVHIPHLAPCAHSARQHSSLLTAPPSVPHEYFRMASDAAAPSPCLVTTEPCPAPSSNTSQGTGAVRPELWHRLSPLTSSCSSPRVCPGGGLLPHQVPPATWRHPITSVYKWELSWDASDLSAREGVLQAALWPTASRDWKSELDQTASHTSSLAVRTTATVWGQGDEAWHPSYWPKC